MFGLSTRAAFPALALLAAFLAAGAADAANVHTLGPTAFAYSETPITIPVYTVTALDQPTTIDCVEQYGCTIELDATIAMRQTGSTGPNLWRIIGKIDGTDFYGAATNAGETLPDGQDSTVTTKQYQYVLPGKHTVQTSVISFDYNAVVDYYGLAYRTYRP